MQNFFFLPFDPDLHPEDEGYTRLQQLISGKLFLVYRILKVVRLMQSLCAVGSVAVW